MNLLRCHILGFGKLADLALTFHRGLNLVFAANEGGKSTLQHFLLGSLYGQLRAGMTTQRRLDPWAEHFKPWRGMDYGGVLWCELGGGRGLEIHRTFGRDETRIEIRSAGGEDITGQYERQKNGDVLFAKTHLGMSKELFESVAVIRENKVADLDGRGTILDRICNLAQTGDEELSAHQSLQILEEALEAIGSERAPTKPYRQSQERLLALQQERKALAARWIEFQEWIQQRNRHAEEISRLQDESLAARHRLTLARWGVTAQTVEALEKMGSELLRLRQEIEASNAVACFPIERLDELNHLVGVQDSLDRRLQEICAAIQTALERLEQAEKDRQGLAPYASLEPEVDLEKITEWLVQFTGLSRQQENERQALARVRGEIRPLEDGLGRLGPAFQDGEVDWQLRARSAAEMEIEASQRSIELAGKLALKDTALSAARRATRRQGSFGLLALTTSLAIALCALIILAQNPVLRMFSFALAAGLSVWAVKLFVNATRSRRSARRIALEINDLQAAEPRLLKEAQNAYSEIHPAMEASGFRTIAEFLAAARQAEQMRQKLADLKTRELEMEHQQKRLAAESDAVYGRLAGIMRRVELDWSLQNLEQQAEVLRQGLRRFRVLDSDYQICLQNVDSLRKEEAKLGSECSVTTSRIQAILSEASVDTAGAFREACRAYQLRQSNQEKEASLRREYERLRGNQRLEEWRQRLQELESQLPGSALTGELFPAVEQVEQEEKRITALLASTREEYARLVERVQQAFQNYRTASEIEEDLALAERDLRRHTKNRDALLFALNTLRSVSREQQEVLAPQLNRVVEQRFLRLCGGRYQEVKVDPDFQVWVREAGTGELRSAKNLSRGTQDQLYFALRFGLLDLVSNAEEPCPCLLDEPFAAYDRARLAEVFEILNQEARRRQLMVFTCREDLRDLALSGGAQLVELPT